MIADPGSPSDRIRDGDHFDTVVVGGGHNGLTAAAYLARTGRAVAVVEQREILGGFCTTEETVPEAPGYRMNPFAADHVLTNIPPTVDDQLDLAAEGLRWVHPDPFYSFIHPGGASIAFWRDPERTAKEIGRINPVDGRSYLEFNRLMTDLWETVAPYLQGHPTRIDPGPLLRIVRHGWRSRRSLPQAVRTLLSSPGSVIDEWFQGEEIRAALACFAVSTLAHLDEPGSGIILSMMAVQHRWGVRRAVGGNGAFVEALTRKVRRHGGRIASSAPVRSIRLRGDRATGVELVDGRRLSANHVVVTTDPWTLAHRLLPDGVLAERTYRELRGMGVLRTNVSVFKGDVAYAARPALRAVGGERLIGTCMLMAPSLEAVRAATAASLAGKLADDIPLWLLLPSVTDRTLVPPGSRGEAAYLFVPSAPFHLAEGEWKETAADYLDRCLDLVESYAPGSKDTVIGAHATTPADLEALSSLHKGHIFHVDMSLSQFGPWRPVPSMSGYRTGVTHLWHAGAGAHPMGTLSGWSGRSVAAAIIRADRRHA